MTQIKNDSTVTFTQVYNDVKEGLHGLGEALKTGDEHVYEVLIRQQIVTSVSYTIALVVGLILLFFGCKILLSLQYDKYGDPKEGNAPKMVIGLAFALVGGMTCLICLSCINQIITGFVNPEYGAMKDIVNFIK